jgi:hypothetical protein
VLDFEGTTATNTGVPVRYSTGRQRVGQLFYVDADASFTDCERRCNRLDACLGYYRWTTAIGVERCRGLADLGTAGGTLEGVPSHSLRKTLTTTTATSTATTSGAVPQTTTPTTSSTATTTATTTATVPWEWQLLFVTPERFGNAKQQFTDLDGDGIVSINRVFFLTSEVTLEKCQQKCSALGDGCKAVYFFTSLDLNEVRCIGLQRPDVKPQTVKRITNDGFSWIKVDSATGDPLPISAQLVQTSETDGSGGGGNGSSTSAASDTIDDLHVARDTALLVGAIVLLVAVVGVLVRLWGQTEDGPARTKSEDTEDVYDHSPVGHRMESGDIDASLELGDIGASFSAVSLSGGGAFSAQDCVGGTDAVSLSPPRSPRSCAVSPSAQSPVSYRSDFCEDSDSADDEDSSLASVARSLTF